MLSRAIVSEFVGSMLLLAAIVGSGIMGQRLSPGNDAIALLANSIATGTALIALIFTFSPISGAHFNPVVTLAAAVEKGIPWRVVPGYAAAQVTGALCGVFIAHAMFGVSILQRSMRSRGGASQLFSEGIATFGLMVVIHGTGKRAAVVPLTVAAYIVAAYWFTASTSFANPAVTLARAFTDTFAGIELSNVAGFVVAQSTGAAAATLLFRWLNAQGRR